MIGIDVLEIKRIKNLAKDEKKLNKIFTKNEIEYFKKYKDNAERVCGFYCAKEAIKKALCCPNNLSFLDIEITHEQNGKPVVNIDKKLYNINNIEISISHSKTVAVAICLVS